MPKRRADGEGTVRKRTDGRWEGRLVVGHKDDGTPLYKSVFAKTQKDLLPKIHALIEEYDGVDLSGDSSMTLAEWCDRWMESYAVPILRPGTIHGYTQILTNYIKPMLGQMRIRSLTTADIQKFYNRLQQTPKRFPGKNGRRMLADSYVRKIHMLFHEILEAAVTARLLPKNPTAGTVVPKCHYPPKRILNDDQLSTFTRAIEQEPLWSDFFYTAITTGLRRGEICGLRWEDLDETTGRLKVRRSVQTGTGGEVLAGSTKTEAGQRTILLPASTLHRLKARHRQSTSPWIFENPLCPEKPLSGQRAYMQLKEILQKNGLPDIRFHDLRHTFATHALACGVDPKTLSGILGHTNASFTLDTYTHVTGDMQKNASQIVSGFVGNLMAQVFPEEAPAAKNKGGTGRGKK